MLFPGAIGIITVILVIVAISFSASLGCLGGLVIHFVANTLISKSETYKMMRQGHKSPENGWPWWTEAKYYFACGWLFTSGLVAYAIAGPLWTFIEWLK